MRIGIGFDAHALVENQPLILGGVVIPHTHGLSGHSDADVLTHAIIDALLGASNLGSIGDHFPDTDPQYKDISSLDLLKSVKILLDNNAYQISNIDCVIIAQKPMLAPYIPTMRSALAKTLEIDPDLVSVKATTTEKLGFTGREQGIAAQSAALLVSAA
ncbi:2-C-methyl-D-erythritol 2,4-cyclodiphosphate synthase [Thermoproteota archaeon]